MVSFEPITNLMNKQMDRREFIKHIGAILVTLVGISALIRAVSNPLSDIKKTPKGYGSGRAYGG